MRIAIVAAYVHPTRQPQKDRSVMQSAVPELIAGLCPPSAEIEIYNEKEVEVPLDRHWDLVFFSYLHAAFEHTRVLSMLFRKRGMTTVAGGRHASYFADACAPYFDAVVTGPPEPNVPRLISDFARGELRPRYEAPGSILDVRPYRWDIVDYRKNPQRLPALEASRGCPFSCSFCVLTGRERYAYRPVRDVVEDISARLRWNRGLFGLVDDWFIFLDNNLGGSPAYLRELCEALVPLRKTWGCACSFNVLRNHELVRLMARAGCRYVYTGIESLDPKTLHSMNKLQNHLGDVDKVIRRCFSEGILLSFGLLIGSDEDTNEYLDNLPRYLEDMQYFAVTFVGIVCPYPGTRFFADLLGEGRLLPGATMRDLDGYTLCHRPKRISPDEVADHYPRLCRRVARFSNIARHYWSRLGASDRPHYGRVVLGSGLKILSVRNPVRNPARRYIAGLDAIEAWDTARMRTLGLEPQSITVPRVSHLPPEAAAGDEPDEGPVKGGDVWVGGDGTAARRATNQLVVGEAEKATGADVNQGVQEHLAFPFPSGPASLGGAGGRRGSFRRH